MDKIGKMVESSTTSALKPMTDASTSGLVQNSYLDDQMKGFKMQSWAKRQIQ